MSVLVSDIPGGKGVIMGRKRLVSWAVSLLLIAALAVVTACGGSSSEQSTGTTYNASAAAGDFIRVTLKNNGDYTYENTTTGRTESGTYATDPATEELSFTADTYSGGGGGSASELLTGFSVPSIGIILIASNTGTSANKESIVFGVRQRTHNLSDITGLVPTGSGGSAEYLYLQFRTNDGGFELGSATILEEQGFTDTLDIDEDGSVIDTITGAPLIPYSYSPIYGMPDPVPVSTEIPMTFSTDVIKAAATSPVTPADVPFLELASDKSYITLRSWEYDSCNKGDPGCSPTLADNTLFFNNSLDKIIIDSPYASGIAVAMSSTGDWDSSYEGTYNMVSYFGSGTATGNQDTAGVPDILVLTFSHDTGGNGTVTIDVLGGGNIVTDQSLTSFNDMASANSLLGNPVVPWPTDGSIPLNGVFGYRGVGGSIGEENFFLFSDGVVFGVHAELNGPRISGGDLNNWPTSYTYQFGAGLKMP